MRVIIQNDKILFGPLKEQHLSVLLHQEGFECHGISAMADPSAGVDIFATFPYTLNRAQELRDWYLRNHSLLG